MNESNTLYYVGSDRPGRPECLNYGTLDEARRFIFQFGPQTITLILAKTFLPDGSCHRQTMTVEQLLAA